MLKNLNATILVLNNVTSDARVIKQYNTLKKSGINAKIVAVNNHKWVPPSAEKFDITYLNTRLLFRSLFFISFLLSVLMIGVIYFLGDTSALTPLLFLFLFTQMTLFLSLLALLFTNIFFPKTWYMLRRKFYPSILETFFKVFSIAVLIKHRPSIVHCHDLNTLSIGVLFKKIRSKTRLIFDAHEVYPHLYGISKLHSERSLRKLNRLLSKVDILMTINSEVAKYYKNQFNFRRAIFVIHNSPPRSSTVISSDEKNLFHKYFGLSRETKVLLYQGGLSEGRGLDQLVSSAEFFPENWVLIIMGWGIIGPRLKAMAKEKTILNKKVFFRPPVEQSALKLWSSSANIGIIPYKNNCKNHQLCSPNKLWEYPSSGLPIIAENLPFLKKVIEENEIGWLTMNESDVRALGKLLESLSESEVDSKSHAALRFFESNSWEKEEPSLLKAYSDCID